MPRRRLISLPVLALLASVITLTTLASVSIRHQAPGELTPDPGDDLLAAVIPDHREDVAAEAASMPRYTVAATLLFPPETVTQPSPAAEPTPADLPVASPQPAPVGSPQASPIAVAGATPAGSPQATPIIETDETQSADTPATVADPESSTATGEPQIVGTVDLHYINTTDEPLEELYIRLYPNLRQYGSGRMIIDNIQVNGNAVEVQAPELHSAPDATPIPIAQAGERDLVIVRIPLGFMLAPDEGAKVRMDFSTTVPITPADENGLFRYTPDSGTWTLAHWFPMLAGFDPRTGWEIDPPAAWSDITFSNTALFDITLTAPEELVLVTTGVEVKSTVSNGHRTNRITTGPVREVAIIAAPGLLSSSSQIGDTTITSWYRPGEESGGETILQWATQSVEIFTELFGPSPYTTLELVSVPVVIGYEFPQLLFIGSDVYPDPETLGSRPGAIEFLVAHEVAHQWWYGLVGSNPHRHAFLDEGLAEYSAVLYFEQLYGDEAAASHLRDGLVHRYALMLVTGGDQVADQPTADFPDAAAYYATAYWKAGLGFQAIREEIGDRAFFAALRSYADAHRFGMATPDDLRVAFEESSGMYLTSLWALWFETDRGRVEIVMDPLPESPALGTPPATPATRPAPVAPIRATPATVSASPIASPTTVSGPPDVATPASSVATPVDGRPQASPAVSCTWMPV